MFDQLKAILVEDLQMRTEDVVATADRAEVGLDSLTVVELSALLSQRLDIQVSDYELLELATVGDIADLVAQRCRA
ncbi:acyl carrier protein [Micromonospora sp. HUAS LYJ1]|uniref:acyl carrier protein n=1 Tax=Micromonospora sp. HUAS LYJ1 TaxID=3061626 RepID=UPI0026716511|nr:phosphopantetheine-binding protein [Micromonospora sp. HUAS LYJ1]WKU02970.1 phosphopantetheine-binding protein [Micromonospora sp. HUAS LYJ1]